jgi:type I restriction enzyme, S subunit
MVLKTIQIKHSKLKDAPSNRFSVKYFLVKSLFNKLSKNNKFKVCNLGDLGLKISSGSYIEEYVKKEEGIPYFRVANIKPYCVDEQSTSIVYVKKEVPEKIKLKKGDIVLGRTQATIEKLGISSMADKTIEGNAISQHLSKISEDPKSISQYYLIAYLNSKFFKAQTALASHGDTRVEMTHSQLKELKIFIPSQKNVDEIEEKSKIIIENNRKSILLIDKAKNILRKELNLDKVKNKPDRIFSKRISDLRSFGIWGPKAFLPKYLNTEEYIKNNFSVSKLGDLAKIEGGVEPGSINYKTYLFKEKEDSAFIRTSDITNNEIDIDPDYFISEEIVDELNNKVEEGDIIFSKDGKIGEVGIISQHDKIIVATGFAKIRLKDEMKRKYKITKEYLFSVLLLNETGMYPTLRRTITASTIPHIRIERLKEINIPLLSNDTVDSITLLIKEAFKLKDEKKKLIKEIKEEIDNYIKF